MRPKKCEHVKAEYFSKPVAQSVAERKSKETGFQHYVRKDTINLVWIVTCHPYRNEGE